MRKCILCMLVLFSLWGCMVGPDYKRPSIDIPESWRTKDNEAKDLVNTLWWEQFDDPVLNELIRNCFEREQGS